MMCAAPLHAAPGGDRRERRVVSVLFADLVGFTSRSELLDVEDVDGFLARYHEVLRRALERCGGTVEKFIGDAVMALFGAPVAHEDDAERAVRAALAIQDAMAELRDHDGVDLHVRVGVTTGEALVALGANPQAGEGMATGDVVNTAARLQSAAPADGVLVDAATHRATDRSIRYADAGPITAKGKSEPVAVWLAIEPRSLVPEQTRADNLPLVGRGSELGHLTHALERSRREPSAQLVTIVGAPGIGKTRLVEELDAHVEDLPDLIRWRRGRSLSYGEGVALWALGEMVKAQAGVLESDSAADTAEKLAAAVSAVIVEERDREWVERHLRPLVGLDAQASVTAEGGRVEAFAAWRRFFEALAEDGPTVLVFEDLHWADDALLDFIDLLSDRAGAVPLLIVCTARPELLDRRPAWSGGKINALTINLAPLSHDDTARLIAELLDQALLPAETQLALLERAEGNPLYAQEYVRMLRDRGQLIRDGGGWRLAGEPEGLPESVQAIIAARLDTLEDAERAFVQDAAVVGRTAWIGAIAAIADRPAWELAELLHALERKQLLRRARRSTVAGGVEFTFSHALTHEVAYNQIRRTERADKHEHAAGWIERLAGERDDKAELLAHHYTTALHLRTQTGEDTADLARRARAALAEAGRQAEAVNAHTAAAGHLEAALALTPADDPARARLLLDLGTTRWRVGDADEATLQAALDAQVAAGDWEAAAEATVLFTKWLEDYSADSDRVDALLADAAEQAARVPYAPVASVIAERQTYRLYGTGRVAESLRVADAAILRADAAGDVEGAALLRMRRGYARTEAGDLSGPEEMREAIDVLARRGHPDTTKGHHNLAEALLGLGDLAGAGDARAEAAVWAERFADAVIIATVNAGRAEAAYHSGDWPAALAWSTSLAGGANRWVATYAQWTRGRVVLAQGDLAVAQNDAQLMLEYAAANDYDEDLFPALALTALTGQALGDAEAARAACTRFLARWGEIGGLTSMAPTLVELAAVPCHEEELGDAAALLPETSRWKQALVAIAERRHDDAAERYREMGSRPLEAGAHLLGARHAAGQGGHADAARHAEAAMAFYRSVGATHYAGQAEALLRTTA